MPGTCDPRVPATYGRDPGRVLMDRMDRTTGRVEERVARLFY